MLLTCIGLLILFYSNLLFANHFTLEIPSPKIELEDRTYREQVLFDFATYTSKIIANLAHPATLYSYAYVEVSGRTAYITCIYESIWFDKLSTKIGIQLNGSGYIHKLWVVSDGALIPPFTNLSFIIGLLQDKMEEEKYQESKAVKLTEKLTGKDWEDWNGKDAALFMLNADWVAEGYWNKYK